VITEERPKKKQKVESTEKPFNITPEALNTHEDIQSTLEAKKKALLQQLQATENTLINIPESNNNNTVQDYTMSIDGSEYYYNNESTFVYREFNWSYPPDLVAKISDVYAKPRNNFLKGVKWAPDGTCLLANSEDNILRVYDMYVRICQIAI